MAKSRRLRPRQKNTRVNSLLHGTIEFPTYLGYPVSLAGVELAEKLQVEKRSHDVKDLYLSIYEVRFG